MNDWFMNLSFRLYNWTIIFDLLYVTLTQIKQFEKHISKRQTKNTIKIQKIKIRFDKFLIYEFEISFMNFITKR